MRLRSGLLVSTEGKRKAVRPGASERATGRGAVPATQEAAAVAAAVELPRHRDDVMSLKPRNVDFQETWLTLKETVRGVVGLRAVERAVWNNRFSDVYALCVAYPEPLADRLLQETQGFLEEHVTGLLERVRGPDPLSHSNHDDTLLHRYYEAWAEYSQGVAYLNSLYSYLNLQHIKRQKVSEAEMIYSASNPNNSTFTDAAGLQLEVGELGLLTWERVLVTPLASALTARILHALAAARDSAHAPSTVHDRTLRAVIHSFVEVQAFRTRNPLALYCKLVETPHLAAAAAQHAHRAAQLLQRDDVSQYMRDVLHGLEAELALSARLLHSSSLERCRACYEQCTVAAHLPALHAECARLVRGERREDLANMYKLLRPLPGALKPLVEAAHRHVADEGAAALAALEHSDVAHVHFVETMLQIHTKYKALFAEVFNSDQAFVGALDKACSTVINTRPAPDQPCRSPELLARYCDALLRKRTGERGGGGGGAGGAGSAAGGVACTEAEAEERLAAAIVVFKYVDDKDVFQKYYARALAKRLIHQLSASMDQEEAMINRLKQACGYEFTNKLHRMFTDVAVSADLNTKFHEHLRAQGTELGIGLSIQVLQAGAWPLGGACVPLAPPPQLERVATLFETFYRAHFSGRRLAWLHHLCAGELRTRYTKRPYHVAASTPQCALLLCFEKQDLIPAAELRQTLQLPAEAFVRHARGLLDALLLTAEGGDIETEEESCSLRLNLAFQSKRTRVRVTCAAGAPGAPGAAPDPSDTPASVDDDRKMYLQAAIVRIMKARKVLRHNELIQEVVAQARSSFAPSVAMIKKCIEALIDKQYLERAPGHSDQYSYVA